PASASLWFLTRGWIAQNLFSGLGGVGLLLQTTAIAVAGGLAVRAAAPLSPPPAAALVASLLLFGASLASPPKLGYTARLWRAAIFGAYSGHDPERRELARVVEEASTPLERRQAAGAWRLYGPPPQWHLTRASEGSPRLFTAPRHRTPP